MRSLRARSPHDRLLLVVLPVLLAVEMLCFASPPGIAQEPPASTETPPAKPPDIIQLPPVSVIGTTPVPSLGVPLEKYPGNARQITAEEIANQNLVNLPEQLFRNLGS